MHHSIFSRISRGSQFQVEVLFAPNTSSLANEMTDPVKVVSIKEEDGMEIYCDDKPLISNLSPYTVMENNNTTQEKPSPVLEFFSSCSCWNPVRFVLDFAPLAFWSFFVKKKLWWFVLTPSKQKIDVPPPASCHSVPVPFTTQYYWKRKLVKEKDGSYTRKFVRRYIQSRKCNKQKITSTHRRYYGCWYCQETDTKPFAEWKAELLKQSSGREKFWRVGSPMHIRLHCSFNFHLISF